MTHITITESATSKIQGLMNKDPGKDLHLRVSITGGGCSGFQYVFKLEEAKDPEDTLIEKNTMADKPIKVLVNKRSLPFLINAEIDYIENLVGSRFIVNNPNAETTCGCGTSFAMKESCSKRDPEKTG